ncbi:TlpA family protein disulfide reductase [Mucilaginibacter jinjuensis]|uniref:TlpA disulfide reductase family protein n=1 Tax=Mucilaginibacter jinjuensis TaxID=1176721 RepID=A0ABY7TBT0_9SPHI|nr:TlpA disulfide reductase family protein [Mucilaginibacter jinjuensis]WCT12682.1 TlpA disulfide reductase family protein [Mucilaginibacter jinjuensis]
MKNNLFLLLTLFTVPALASNHNNEANKILTQTADKLLSIQTVSYHYERDISYPKENYHSKASAQCYLEFDKEKVSKFQLNSEATFQVYNGTEYFSLDKKAKTYELKEQPDGKAFNSFSYFYNSIPSFRSILYQIIRDDSISKTTRDTVIANKPYHIVSLAMQNKGIDYLGSFRNFTTVMAMYYDIIIDPASSLPYQIIERNSHEKTDITKVTYTDINISPNKPQETSWYYSTYTKEYQPEKKIANKPMIAAGAILPDWQLPVYKGDTLTTLQNSSLKGKVILMEFWIKNCSYCMESFTYLKELQQKFNAANVQIITINAYDSPKEIGFFYNREKPAYKMLYAGQALAKDLGIYSYPQAILVDKSGKVIFAGTFGKDSKTQIEQLITKQL